MASIKDLRQRIKSVGSIKQITRAMEMVATTKLRRFQDRAIASRPYTEEIAGLVGRLASMLGEDLEGHPLFRRGAGERTLLLVVSSDRGLCGPYNSSLFRKLQAWRKERGGRDADPTEYFVVGRKGYQYMDRRGFRITRFLTEPPLEKIDYRNAAVTARMLTQSFLSGEYSDVQILSTRFESMVKFVPTIAQFLPVSGASIAGEGGERIPAGVILEPDAATIFDQLIPRYLETRAYNALLESLTSEYASRRFAMKNATDAASDMQKALRGVYNRKRQESITKELLDIVGGVEALK
ncbi:MAG: ATP synthase F1 subunit gamma [Planctomycetota bacterium]|nr:MAG: ATP synthase F1 subunit gamma [Planctomycetota bacterium]